MRPAAESAPSDERNDRRDCESSTILVLRRRLTGERHFPGTAFVQTCSSPGGSVEEPCSAIVAMRSKPSRRGIAALGVLRASHRTSTHDTCGSAAATASRACAPSVTNPRPVRRAKPVAELHAVGVGVVNAAGRRAGEEPDLAEDLVIVGLDHCVAPFPARGEVGREPAQALGEDGDRRGGGDSRRDPWAEVRPILLEDRVQRRRVLATPRAQQKTCGADLDRDGHGGQ